MPRETDLFRKLCVLLSSWRGVVNDVDSWTKVDDPNETGVVVVVVVVFTVRNSSGGDVERQCSTKVVAKP